MEKLMIDCDIINLVNRRVYSPKAAWYDTKSGWVKLEMADAGKTVLCYHHESLSIEVL